MRSDDIESVLRRAEEQGYTLSVRHQPGAEGEQPDWVVVIQTPRGDRVFPAAIDDEEHLARRRAAIWLASRLDA